MPARAWGGVRRRDPVVARVVRDWRRLTNAQRTLVACSGGADSVALALILRAATDDLALAHVVHDLRPAEETEGDRAFVEALADSLEIPFACARVSVPSGNAEGEARRVRYAALARLADEHDCAFVASAHHAHDQLEGVVMALLRGASPRGLGAARESRLICCDDTGASATLVRPALRVGRDDLQRICRECSVDWRIDATNTDTDRARAVLRHGPLAEIESMRPGTAHRAARSAELLRDAAGLVDDRAREVFGNAYEWDRNALRDERAIVVGAGLRNAFARLTDGAGLDRLSGEMLEQAVDAVRDTSGETRTFDWPGATLTVQRARVAIDRR